MKGGAREAFEAHWSNGTLAVAETGVENAWLGVLMLVADSLSPTPVISRCRQKCERPRVKRRAALEKPLVHVPCAHIEGQS